MWHVMNIINIRCILYALTNNPLLQIIKYPLIVIKERNCSYHVIFTARITIFILFESHHCLHFIGVRFTCDRVPASLAGRCATNGGHRP
jgi:uncharacterized membrane protein YjdF